MRAILLGACTGALLACAAPPHQLYPLVFIAFVPLLRAADSRCGAAAVGSAGWTSGAVFYLAVSDWLPATIGRLQGVGCGVAWAVFALFVAVHALQFALAAMLAALLAGTTAQRARLGWFTRAAATAAAWVLLDWGFPKVFPWSIGALLGRDPLLRQGAELGGVYGLALLVLLVNALIAEGTRWRCAPGRRMRATGIAGGIVGVALAHGAWRTPVAPRSDRSGLRIGVVQGGSAARAPDPLAANVAAFATYAALTRSAAAAADLFVWPENALRVYVRDNDLFRDRLAALVRATRRPLLFGALDRSAGGTAELNGAYLFAPGAGMGAAAVYHKAALLPFGEYVPGAHWWPAQRRWRTTGNFVRGAPPSPLDVELRGASVRLAPSICFEATRPGAFNDLVRRGAALLVNLTDDSWFASEAAAAQHLELARLRAVETRRWLVRASNSGISAFVDPAGRLATALPLGVVGVLVHRVDTGSVTTLYVRWGEWVVALCCALVCIDLVHLCAAAAAHRSRAPSPCGDAGDRCRAPRNVGVVAADERFARSAAGDER